MKFKLISSVIAAGVLGTGTYLMFPLGAGGDDPTPEERALTNDKVHGQVRSLGYYAEGGIRINKEAWIKRINPTSTDYRRFVSSNDMVIIWEQYTGLDPLNVYELIEESIPLTTEVHTTAAGQQIKETKKYRKRKDIANDKKKMLQDLKKANYKERKIKDGKEVDEDIQI